MQALMPGAFCLLSGSSSGLSHDLVMLSCHTCIQMPVSENIDKLLGWSYAKVCGSKDWTCSVGMGVKKGESFLMGLVFFNAGSSRLSSSLSN